MEIIQKRVLFLSFLSACCVTVTLAGCGGRPEQASVKGKATLDGTPLAFVEITFHGADGKKLTANVGEDGTYFVNAIPVGEYKITAANKVRTMEEKIAASKKPPSMPAMKDPTGAVPYTAPALGKDLPIPMKYRSDSASGFKLTVVPGEQTYDLPMSAK